MFPEANVNRSGVKLKKLLTLSTLLCVLYFAVQAPAHASSFTTDTDNKPAENELKVSLVPVYEQLTEKLLFGQRHAGFGAGGALGMVFHQHEHRHEISFWGHYGQVTNPDGLPALNVKTGFLYSYARQVFTSQDNRLTWHIGPQVAVKYSVQHFMFIDESHVYWLTRYDVAMNNWLMYSVNNRVSLHGMVSLPVAGIMSRPSYRRNYNNDLPEVDYIIDEIHQNREFSSLNDYVQIQLEMGARFEFDEKWSETVSYQMDYSYTNVPKVRKALDQALLLTVHYRFSL